MILVIDNYDSFTFNLTQLLGELAKDVQVKRNDEITVGEIRSLNPSGIVISPGPGKPQESNVSLEVITELGKSLPILGVCLGHQGIAYAFGAKINYAPRLMHGKASQIIHDGKTIFKNIEQRFRAARYHSLVVDEKTLPEELEITARTDDGIIMGIRHKYYPIEGIQFHPESILTKPGKKIIRNWLEEL